MGPWLRTWPWSHDKPCPCQNSVRNPVRSLATRYRKQTLQRHPALPDPAALSAIEQYLLAVLVYRSRSTIVLENFTQSTEITDMFVRILQWAHQADVWYDDEECPVVINLHPLSWSAVSPEVFAQSAAWPRFIPHLFRMVESGKQGSHSLERYQIISSVMHAPQSPNDTLNTICHFLELTTLPGTIDCGQIALAVTGWPLDAAQPPAVLIELAAVYHTLFLYGNPATRYAEWLILCRR